jgi:hypothetical protein
MRLSFHVVAATADRWDVRDCEASGPSVSRHHSLDEAKDRALQLVREVGGGEVIVHDGQAPVVIAA